MSATDKAMPFGSFRPVSCGRFTVPFLDQDGNEKKNFPEWRRQIEGVFSTIKECSFALCVDEKTGKRNAKTMLAKELTKLGVKGTDGWNVHDINILKGDSDNTAIYRYLAHLESYQTGQRMMYALIRAGLHVNLQKIISPKEIRNNGDLALGALEGAFVLTETSDLLRELLKLLTLKQNGELLPTIRAKIERFNELLGGKRLKQVATLHATLQRLKSYEAVLRAKVLTIDGEDAAARAAAEAAAATLQKHEALASLSVEKLFDLLRESTATAVEATLEFRLIPEKLELALILRSLDDDTLEHCKKNILDEKDPELEPTLERLMRFSKRADDDEEQGAPHSTAALTRALSQLMSGKSLNKKAQRAVAQLRRLLVVNDKKEQQQPNGGNPRQPRGRKRGSKHCSHHGECEHTSEECTVLHPELRNLTPDKPCKHCKKKHVYSEDACPFKKKNGAQHLPLSSALPPPRLQQLQQQKQQPQQQAPSHFHAAPFHAPQYAPYAYGQYATPPQIQPSQFGAAAAPPFPGALPPPSIGMVGNSTSSTPRWRRGPDGRPFLGMLTRTSRNLGHRAVSAPAVATKTAHCAGSVAAHVHDVAREAQTRASAAANAAVRSAKAKSLARAAAAARSAALVAAGAADASALTADLGHRATSALAASVATKAARYAAGVAATAYDAVRSTAGAAAKQRVAVRCDDAAALAAQAALQAARDALAATVEAIGDATAVNLWKHPVFSDDQYDLASALARRYTEYSLQEGLLRTPEESYLEGPGWHQLTAILHGPSLLNGADGSWIYDAPLASLVRAAAKETTDAAGSALLVKLSRSLQSVFSQASCFVSPTLARIIANAAALNGYDPHGGDMEIGALPLVVRFLEAILESGMRLAPHVFQELSQRLADFRSRPEYHGASGHGDYPNLGSLSLQAGDQRAGQALQGIRAERETQGKRAGLGDTAAAAVVRIGNSLFSLANSARNDFVLSYDSHSPSERRRLRNQYGFRTRRGVQLYRAALLQDRGRGHRGRTRTRGGHPRMRSRSADTAEGGRTRVYWHGDASLPPRIRAVDFQ